MIQLIPQQNYFTFAYRTDVDTCDIELYIRDNKHHSQRTVSSGGRARNSRFSCWMNFDPITSDSSKKTKKENTQEMWNHIVNHFHCIISQLLFTQVSYLTFATICDSNGRSQTNLNSGKCSSYRNRGRIFILFNSRARFEVQRGDAITHFRCLITRWEFFYETFACDICFNFAIRKQNEMK